MSNSFYPKKYVTETWKSFKYITFPGTDKPTKTVPLKFPKGIRFGLEGITPDYDKEDIIKDAYTNIFKSASDLEPKANGMEIDWMRDEQTIQIVFKYPNKNIHYFFKWWFLEEESDN